MRLTQPLNLLKRRALIGRQNSILGPARGGNDTVALLEFGRGRLEDGADGAGAHDLADLHGRDVEALRGRVIGDPSALGRVVGEVADFEQDLVVFEFGDGVGHELELLRGVHFCLWVGGEEELLGLGGEGHCGCWDLVVGVYDGGREGLV